MLGHPRLRRDLMVIAVTGILVGVMGGPGFAFSLIFLLSIRFLEFSERARKKIESDKTNDTSD